MSGRYVGMRRRGVGGWGSVPAGAFAEPDGQSHSGTGYGLEAVAGLTTRY